MCAACQLVQRDDLPVGLVGAGVLGSLHPLLTTLVGRLALNVRRRQTLRDEASAVQKKEPEADERTDGQIHQSAQERWHLCNALDWTKHGCSNRNGYSLCIMGYLQPTKAFTGYTGNTGNTTIE